MGQSKISHVNISGNEKYINIESTVKICHSSSKCKDKNYKNNKKISKLQNSRNSDKSGGNSSKSGVPANICTREREAGPHLLQNPSTPFQTPPQLVQTGIEIRMTSRDLGLEEEYCHCCQREL